MSYLIEKQQQHSGQCQRMADLLHGLSRQNLPQFICDDLLRNQDWLEYWFGLHIHHNFIMNSNLVN